MEDLLNAIVDDDVKKVRKLLKEDSSLAIRLCDTAKLFESKIAHWIYVGDSALHLAAAGYRVEIIQLLLESGADANSAKNHRRGCPLHYAADGYINGPDWDEQRQVKALATLIDAGASIDAQDKNGATPLHRAVRTRCAAAVKFLLKAGSDPSTKNKSGSTPFHLAVQNTGRGGSGADVAIAAQRQIVESLLQFGVSAELKDGNGKTVLECAKSGWVREMLTGT